MHIRLSSQGLLSSGRSRNSLSSLGWLDRKCRCRLHGILEHCRDPGESIAVDSCTSSPGFRLKSLSKCHPTCHGQRDSEASIRLDLHRFQEPVELDDLASKLEPAFNGSANIHLESSEHTFGAFRCRSCGMANRKERCTSASCLQCSTAYTFSPSCEEVSVSRPRKMELCFSGSRSDLGHANMLLTNDDLPLRLTSSFDTGARVRTALFAPLTHLSEYC